MLYYLHHWEEWFGPLRVFSYVSFRGIGGALTAFLACLWLGPVVVRMLTRLKLGQPIRGREEVHQLADLHGGKRGTPTMGGVLIMLTGVGSALLWVRPDNVFLWVVLVPTLLLGLLGFADDYLKVRRKHSAGISSRQKLLGQMVVGALVGLFLLVYPETAADARNLHIPFVKLPVVNLGWAAVFFFILVITGTSNAVNLTDGLDGLAAGCAVAVTSVLGVFAYLSDHAELTEYLLLPRTPGASELSVLCAVLAGAEIGFLWFNCHPARVFMGDTGSLALGGALAMIAICINQELLLVIIGGVFVLEALSVILQVASFKLTGRRIFAMSPLHHHFELKGWSESTVVVRFWILGLVCALLGLASLKLR
jgi:phospho-N-acetylmuramoyl-pentapeptide-transferase